MQPPETMPLRMVLVNPSSPLRRRKTADLRLAGRSVGRGGKEEGRRGGEGRRGEGEEEGRRGGGEEEGRRGGEEGRGEGEGWGGEMR